jgi:arylsulfatase A
MKKLLGILVLIPFIGGFVFWKAADEPAAENATATKPNIVFIMADDLGYGDIGAFGATDIRTPNIDELARKGIRFTEFYCASPVCSPTRAGLLTGRYPRRMGIDGVFFPESFTGIPPSEVTLAEALKDQGYTTGVVGKWHLGHHKPYLPLQNGFDEYFGIPYSNDMQGVVYIRGNDVVEYEVDQHYTTKVYTDEAVAFINRHKNKPFFLYLAHTMPHVPIYASPAFEGKSKRGLYGDVIEELDWSVGQVVEALRKNGLEKNTLVVFTSDNGPWLAFDVEGGSAGPLREGKQTTFEGGMRVPTVAYWPEKIKAGTVYENIATHFDFFPTFVKLAGAINYQPKNPLDGEDISAVLTGQGKRRGDELLYYYNGKVQAFRKGDWKIKFPYAGNQGIIGIADVAPHDTLLVNLKQDVGEKRNLLQSNPEKARELLSAMQKHLAGIEPTPQSLVQRMPADDSHKQKYLERKAKMAATKQ